MAGQNDLSPRFHMLIRHAAETARVALEQGHLHRATHTFTGYVCNHKCGAHCSLARNGCAFAR